MPPKRSNDEQPPPTASYQAELEAAHGEEAVARYRETVLPKLHYDAPRPTLAVGDRAPSFMLTDTAGQAYELANLLRSGPVVAIFYRGGWCPFCNVQLRAFQLARKRLLALQATVVLISPESLSEALSLVEQQALQFPVLIDRGNQVAQAYNIAVKLNPEQRANHLAYDVDLSSLNAGGEWELPMPATFVIDRTQTIRYAFIGADYTQRAEPEEVISALQRLGRLGR